MKITTTLISVFLLILSFGAFSKNEWNHPNEDDGRNNFYFQYQKDVEGHIGDKATDQASVTYNGKIFNFFYYEHGTSANPNGVISMRILHNTGTADKLGWGITPKQDGEDILGYGDNIYPYQQPTPVVFKGVLYLFFSEMDKVLCYITYNDETGKWSKKNTSNYSNDKHFLGYGAATVIGDKLCLVHHYSDDHLQIMWTTDPSNSDGWQHAEFGATVYKENNLIGVYWNPISVITKTYMKGSTVCQKLQVAYITPNEHARFAEYEFDATGALVQLQNVQIDSDLNYSSVALAQGSVYNDPKSKGNCTQMFLKKANLDNGYRRWRILRWELREGEGEVWHRGEKNIVPQNSPSKMWADSDMNLTAVNFSILDDDVENESGNMKQYMVLIYRGYDDGNNPLNCAWSRTDDLKYESYLPDQALEQDLDQDKINDPRKYRQYIGYIEGPPPFYKNHPSSNNPANAFVNHSGASITGVDYEYSGSSKKEKEIKFEGSVTSQLHIGPVKSEVGFTHCQKKAFTSKVTFTYKNGLEADTVCEGRYIYLAPLITRTTYGAYNNKAENSLYPVYCYTMQMALHEEPEELKNGLEADNPQTYQHRILDTDTINLNLYPRMSSGGITIFDYIPGDVSSSSTTVENEYKLTNSRSQTFKLSAKMGHVFEAEAEKTGEYSSTVTTVEENKVNFNFAFNPALNHTDVKKLQYRTYWIKPKTGLNNYWLKDTEINPDQNTWCITYQVGMIILNNNDTIFGAVNNSDNNPNFEQQEKTNPSLTSPAENLIVKEKTNSIQCYPNPFTSTTKIKYQIGDTGLPANSTGCTATLVIYNLSGQQVANLVNENKAPGNYEVEWDASHLTPGVYFCSLQSGSFKDVKKLILLK